MLKVVNCLVVTTVRVFATQELVCAIQEHNITAIVEEHGTSYLMMNDCIVLPIYVHPWSITQNCLKSKIMCLLFVPI